MKAIYFLLISLMVLPVSCKTIRPLTDKKAEVKEVFRDNPGITNKTTKSSDQEKLLLGYFNVSQLTSEPYSEWFIKEYDDYQLSSEVINKLFDLDKEGLTIKIVMGTWCPDSRREVPRFMRILDIWQFPAAGVAFIGVDREKHPPVDEYDKLDIHLVPTFIIYKNNIEAGRIIEKPATSLEQDMVNIFTGMNSNK